MRKLMLCAAFVLIALAGLATTADAQAPVNIVYPISGATYPFTDPPTGPLKSHYFTSSFSVTCQGDHTVEWGYDAGPAIGKSTFYDQTSVQFVYKLPGGTHVFWVTADCGKSEVKFTIGA